MKVSIVAVTITEHVEHFAKAADSVVKCRDIVYSH